MRGESKFYSILVKTGRYVAISIVALISIPAFAQPTVWGSASPSVVEANTETVTLSWGSSGASSCESGGSVFPTSGSVSSGPFPAGNHSITFSCTGAGGTSYYTVYWVAENPPPPPPTPVLSYFTLSPATVLTTDPITLSWSSSNASSCSASTGDTFGPSGSVSYPAGTLPAGTHSFSMQCYGAGGSSNVLYASVTVQSPPVPVLNSFALSDTVIFADESVTASWNSSYATQCSIPGEGSYPASGSQVFPANSFAPGSYSYTMSCTGAGGTSNPVTVTLTVESPLPAVPGTPAGLVSSNPTPETGQAYTISWNAVSGATSYQLSENSIPASYTGTSHTLSKGSSGSYSYQISACNAGGCSAASSAISVTVTAVTPPVPDPLYLIGFDSAYSAYWLSSSTENDLYFERDNSDGNYEGVTGFILDESVDGSYSLIANPSPAQIALFDLGTPGAVPYDLADINLDGATDLILLDAANLAVGIVYSDTTSQSNPIAYKHVDEEFIEFFEQLYSGLVDPDYFKNKAIENNWGTWSYAPLEHMYFNAATLHRSGQYFRKDANYPPSEPGVPFFNNISEAYDPLVKPYWCELNDGLYGFVNGSWWVYGWYHPATFTPDYSYFNQDAMGIAAVLRQGMATTGFSGEEAALRTVQEYLGLDLPGYNLFSTHLVGGVVIDIDDYYSSTDRPLFRSISLFRILRGIALLVIPGNYWDEEKTEYFHYTTEGGYPLIRDSGDIVTETSPYLVFFTTQIYSDGVTAMQKLATPSIRYGFFVVSDRIGELSIPGLVGPGVVAPRYGQPGGGLEWTAPSPVSIGPNRVFVKIPSGL